MRIIAGSWRGRPLRAPPGDVTRPTADRVRQALFDMLLHAPWGGAAAVVGRRVLDAFAGTGALGLEALSRGAAAAHFIEQDRAALAALAANIAACGAAAHIHRADALRPPPGQPCDLVLLDPPYGQDLAARAVIALAAAGWLAPDALLIAECARDGSEAMPGTLLASRDHGRARLTFHRYLERDRLNRNRPKA